MKTIKKRNKCGIYPIEMMINDIDGELDLGQTEMSARALVSFLEYHSTYEPFTKKTRQDIKRLLKFTTTKNKLKKILDREIVRRLKSKWYK